MARGCTQCSAWPWIFARINRSGPATSYYHFDQP